MLGGACMASKSIEQKDIINNIIGLQTLEDNISRYPGDTDISVAYPCDVISYTVQNEGLTGQSISINGTNILENRTPVICDAFGHQLMPLWDGDCSIIVECNDLLHVDILGTLPVTLYYDMENEITADQIVVASMYNEHQDFALANYELYISQDISNLFNKENCIVKYNNVGVWKPHTLLAGATQIFSFNKKTAGRFFGMKVLKANPTDEVVRIARLAVYSEIYNQQHEYLSQFGNNLLIGADVHAFDRNNDNVWPKYGCWKQMTDGIVADKMSSTEIRVPLAPLTLQYRIVSATAIDTFVIVGEKRYMPRVELYIGEKEHELFHHMIMPASTEDEIVSGDIVARIFRFLVIPDAKYAAILLYPTEHTAPIRLDQIGLYGQLRQLCINPDKIINADFWGNGANIVPFSLQPGNIKAGYSLAHWEMDAKRIIMMKPRLVRVWMQVDWLEKNKGDYIFNTPEMQGVYTYFDVFKQAGTEIQITYNWKVGKSIQSWFSIPGVHDQYISAPADIEAFAASCSALLQELWRQGYDNVKHFAIANEPNLSGDFACFGNKREYYVKVFRAVDSQLRKDGIRDKVKLWGPESAEDYMWVLYCSERLSDCIDLYCTHDYRTPSLDLHKMVEKAKNAGAFPFAITEFGEDAFYKNSWRKGYAGHLINGANAGLSSLLIWTLHGVKSMSPIDSDSWEMDNYGDLWSSMLSNGMPHESYYIMSLLMRYIPAHCRVISVDVSQPDVRATAFATDDGDYTIVLECTNGQKNRQLSMEFPDNFSSKVFYKHLYLPKTVQPEQNAIIPPVCGAFEIGSSFIDTIDDEYSVTVYTTMKPQTQVVVEPARATIKAGEMLLLTAVVVDNNDGVTWSVSAGGGTVTADGQYTPPIDNHDSWAAIKAVSNVDPDGWGIALIRIE
jgi:hypothetical protein